MRNYFKIGLLEKCVIYSFCIDNEHDEGKIKVETFFLFLFNQSNFKILIANSKVDLLVKKQLIFPSLLESHPVTEEELFVIFLRGQTNFGKFIFNNHPQQMSIFFRPIQVGYILFLPNVFNPPPILINGTFLSYQLNK